MLTPSAPKLPMPNRPCRPRWEHRLPKSYTVAAAPGANSLFLLFEIQSTDSALRLSVNTLVDCRATSEFINADYVS